MKRLGILLSAGTGGGVLQYSQAIVDAADALPAEYSITAAIADPLWRGTIPPRMRVLELDDSLWNRGLNRVSHASRMSVAVWRHTLARLDTNVRRLVSENCDLWICPNHDRYVFRAPIPALGTVHDLMHRYERKFPEVSANGEFEAREFHFRETGRWAKGLLVDSKLGKSQLVDSYGVAPEKVHVLPYIAPAYIHDDDGDDIPTVRQRYNLPPKFFFYPAQFYQHKNHLRLIDAVAGLRETHPDVKLVLVGAKERNGYDAVRRHVSWSGLEDSVIFLGYVPDGDMPALYRTARALVMPTFFGPTNIPQLEAFALGCPVATSRIYGIPAQVGDAAMLFDPESVSEIQDCLARLWTDDALCAELVARGHRHAEGWGRPQFRERFREIVEALL
ncbi:MAG: glycosyltransferase family 1 protein [Gemmatimonadaceae bacterium]